MESFWGGDFSLPRVTGLSPGLYFLGLQKLRNWPRKFLDKWLLTGRARPTSSLGTLTGIHTRLYYEAVPLAVLPCESSTGPHQQTLSACYVTAAVLGTYKDDQDLRP